MENMEPIKNNKEQVFEEIKKELEQCQKQKEEYLAGWQRARADILNYKKEEIARMQELLKLFGEGLILKTIPILDNFEIASQQEFSSESLDKEEKEKIDQIIQGFLRIKIQLQDFLKSQGVEEIKTKDEKFDPNLHEAVEEIEEKNKEPGLILEEIKKGYKIDNRVLRPAKVKITQLNK